MISHLNNLQSDLLDKSSIHLPPYTVIIILTKFKVSLLVKKTLKNKFNLTNVYSVYEVYRSL